MRSLITISSLAVQMSPIAIVVWILHSDGRWLSPDKTVARRFSATRFSTIFLTNYSVVSPRTQQIALIRVPPFSVLD